ncbi:MAG TPA: ABC transporter ATP-binding protein, partial [Porphyromonadaceae bacterium]|nr:ABC transporter ATP-binding protein [Porphyromonadaceae bacterium]
PFSGFDPINGELLRQLIERLNRKGTTIVLSSHNMEAVERMCNRIAMIDHGHIMLDGDLTEIKERYRDGSLIISTRGELHLPLLQDSGIIKSIDAWSDAHAQRGFTYRMTLKPDVPNSELLRVVSMQGDIIRFEEHLPSLNEIFLGITAR